MNVLSLFDGMSCGRIALERAGIKVNKYYSSEIDKYAIQISKKNYPDIIQVGDVCNLDPADFQDIDLLIGGSPCTGFSFAGKQLAFDDPQSVLFFEFVRILEGIKPKYFLLENVRMKKPHVQLITEMLCVSPLLINSSLVSAQSRQRYYWTNIPGVEPPKDKGIVLKDILEDDAVADLVGNMGKRVIRPNIEKGSTLLARDYKGWNNYGMTGVRLNKPLHVGDNIEQVKVRRHEVDIKELQLYILKYFKESGKTKKEVAAELGDKFTTVEHYFRSIGSQYFAIPSEEHWPKLKKILNINDDTWDARIMEFDIKDGVYESTQRVYSEMGKAPTITASNKEQYIEIKQIGIAEGINGHDLLKRVYSKDGKSPTLNTMGGGNREPKIAINEESEAATWRKITCVEAERLQTVPDNYTEGVSNTQRLKMLGNGWTVDVVAHLFEYMKDPVDPKPIPKQLRLYV
tara:strand:+ start:1143 stop:2519 length:1377 start_codon:yes stop_codon:yes gene_type:complete